MSETTIGEIVARQYDRMWTSLRDAIAKLSDQQWRESECDWLAPVRLAYHLIEAADFYGADNVKGFQKGSLGGNWEYSPTADLPSPQQMLGLLDRVQPKMRAWLKGCSDQAFLAEQTDFPWTGETRLDQAIYALRHCQHHLGQINAELRHKGLPRGEWA